MASVEPAPIVPAPLTRLPERGLGGRRKRRPERHDQILLVGVRLFNERGYHATSVEEIAELVEISPTAVYRHFRHKQEILDTAAIWVADQLWQRLSAVADELPPTQRLLRYTEDLVDTVLDVPDFIGLLTRELHSLSPDARKQSLSRRHQYTGRLSKTLMEVVPGLTKSEAELRIHLGLALVCSLPTYHQPNRATAQVTRAAFLGALGVSAEALEG